MKTTEETKACRALEAGQGVEFPAFEEFGDTKKEALVRAEVDGRAVCFQLDRVGVRYRLGYRGAQLDALVCEPRAARLNRLMLAKTPPDLSKYLLSPMPGLLVRLAVTVGQELKAGEEIAVVEAMKMENSLRAMSDVTVTKILVEQGQSLVVDQPIVEFG